MTHDEQVRAELSAAALMLIQDLVAPPRTGDGGTQVSSLFATAIPPLTLKTENGCFVKVEPWDPRWETPYRPEHIYRIVEDPAQ